MSNILKGVAAALAGIVSVALVSPLGGCGGPAGETRVVRMGIVRDDLHQTAYYVAREKGFFADRKLDVVEGGAFDSGPEEMSAFSAGELDMGYVGISSAVTFAGLEMADIRIVAQVNAEGSAVLVRNGLEAPDIVSLECRTVAVPGYSTIQDLLLRIALEKAGVSEEDVNTTVLKPTDMLPALEAAQIDAAVAWEPYPSMMLGREAGRTLLDSGMIWKGHPCCVLVADAAFMRRNPETVRRVVAAHVMATRYITENGLEAADIANLFAGQATAVARAAIDNIEFSYTPRVKDIARYVGFLEGNGVVKVGDATSYARALVDTSFLPGDRAMQEETPRIAFWRGR